MKPYQFISNKDFENIDLREKFMESLPEMNELSLTAQRLPANISKICGMPLLNKQQEQHLFRQFNCLKYCANFAIDGNNEQLYNYYSGQIKEINDILLLCNIRLITSFLDKRKYHLQVFLDRFSDCVVFAMNAIDKFDYARGNKFSTYLTWTLIMSLVRVREIEEKRNRVNFINPEKLYGEEGHKEPIAREIKSEDELDDKVKFILDTANLSELQRIIFEENIGLYGESKNFSTIKKNYGINFNISRLIQIKKEAKNKIKKVIEDNYLLDY